jgi:DNA-binding CsgD family transcriptional regulator
MDPGLHRPGEPLKLQERIDSLTKSERAVVRSLRAKKSYREIALDRKCSEHTVRTLIDRAYRKLGIHSRYDLLVCEECELGLYEAVSSARNRGALVRCTVCASVVDRYMSPSE